MCVDGLQVVDEFHRRYPGNPGPLENVFRGLELNVEGLSWR